MSASTIMRGGKPLQINFDAGGSTYAAGDVIVSGKLPLVTSNDIPSFTGGATLDSVSPGGGIYEVVADGALAPGDRVFWDASAKKVTLTAGSNKHFGIVVGGSSGRVDTGLPASDGDRCWVLHKPVCDAVQAVGIGASTAAAGSTYADAGALPAGTARVYPTTAADDTKGVIIDAADKVTGRTLFIGNGVSNKILKVYGPAGAVINGASANAAFSSAAGKGVIITCLSGSGNTWLAW